MNATPATALTRTSNTIKKKEFARKVGKSLRTAFLTENNHCDATLEDLRSLDCQYICFQTEIGEKNEQLHYHAVIKFKNSCRFSTIKKMFPRANIQAVRNFTKAREYCLKSKTFNGTRYEKNRNNVITDERLEFKAGKRLKIKTLVEKKREIFKMMEEDKELKFWFNKLMRTEVPLTSS